MQKEWAETKLSANKTSIILKEEENKIGIFNNIKEPIFLNESNNVEKQIGKLKALEPFLNSKGQAILKQDIRNLEYGIVGEKKIAFELKNSNMPMYILHDIYLEDEDLSAQIDYLVFTRKICFVIECKNLYGDIEINNAGDFIRTTEFGGKKRKEGIYSPITQNQRHIELMKKLKIREKNIVSRFMADKYFEDFNKSVVVLANSKTVLNVKFAKKEVKEKVIRADQLVKYIKDMYGKSKELASSEEKTLLWAQFYLDSHKNVVKDYTKKYEEYKVEIKGNEEFVEETDLFKELKLYRLNKSREANIKPYYIYSDNQIRDLISKMPKNRGELHCVPGFDGAKGNKYGNDILEIIRRA